MRLLTALASWLSLLGFSFVDLPSAEAVIMQVRAEHRQSAEVKVLLEAVRDKQLRQKAPEKVAEAINRLGELREVEAIDDLVELLDFKSPTDDLSIMMQPTHYSLGYPAVPALFRIGKPAVPALVRALAANPIENQVAKNARLTLMSIFRDDLLEGAAQLEKAASEASTTQARRRLEAIASDLRKLGKPPR